MGTFNHTPDPEQGALVEAAGVVVLPDDNEKAKADNIVLGDEQIIDWVAFLTKGPDNDIDFKITGNGEPPADGYAPKVRDIYITDDEGFGLKVDILKQPAGKTWMLDGTSVVDGSLELSGSLDFDPAATSTGMQPNPVGFIGDVSSSITVTKREYQVSPPTTGNKTTKILDPDPEPPAGHAWTTTLWTLVGSVGHSRNIVREDDELIGTFQDNTYCSLTLSWYPSDNKWYVVASTGTDLVNPT